MGERALQGYEKAIGPERANTDIPALNTNENVATLYAQLDKLPQATALYLRCQAGLKSVFGIQHIRNQEVTQTLASLRERTG